MVAISDLLRSKPDRYEEFGGDYTLIAWHEELGEQTADVTVTAGGTAQADFEMR